MKKIAIATLISSLMFVTNSFASVPNVSCELMYSKTDKNGVSVVFKRGNNVQITIKGVSDTNGPFELNAILVQECAADGGPCSENYKLHATISKDDSKTGLQVSVVPGVLGWQRWSSSLDVGNESGFLNCDLETRAK